MSRVLPVTSERVPIKIQGRSLGSLRSAQGELASKVGPFVISDFRDLEMEEFKPIEISYDLKADEDYAILVVKNEGQVTDSSQSGETVTFRWKPTIYVGDYELTLTTYNRSKEIVKSHRFVLRIIPWKVHEDDFFQMYNDLRERHLEIYNLLSPAAIEEREKRRRRSNLLEQAKILEDRIQELEIVTFLISQNPKKELVQKLERRLLQDAYGIDYRMLLDLAGASGGLMPAPSPRIAPHLQRLLTHKRTGTPHLPESVLSKKTEISYDVFENRLLKRFLMMLMELLALYGKFVEWKLRRMSQTTQSEDIIGSLKEVLAKASQLRTRVSLMLDYAFLKDVETTTRLTHVTPTLEKEINYRRFYQIYQDFLTSPYFQTSDIFRLGIKNLPTIYEYWCTLFLCESVLSLIDQNWTLVSENILTRNRLGYGFEIKKRGPLLSLRQNSKRVSIYFQRAFTPSSQPYCSYTHTQRPDISVEINTQHSNRLVILDPKYRYSLQFGEDPESGINKMHVYKDSIRDLDGNKVVSNAYVLYPGIVGESLDKGDMEFRVGSLEIIGAIALRPAPHEELESRKEKLLDLVTNLP